MTAADRPSPPVPAAECCGDGPDGYCKNCPAAEDDDVEKAARAEAERRYRGPRMHVGTVVDREVGAFVDGWLSALGALASPEVLQGIAEEMWGSIDDKGIRGRLFRDDCDYLAAVVVAALTGRAS